MEEITEFMGRAAAVLAFISAVAITLYEIDILSILSELTSAAHLFRTII